MTSLADWDSLRGHLRDVLHKDIFKLSVSAAARKFSESKGKSRQGSNHHKRVLEAGKLAYANETKKSITSQKRGSWDF